MLALLIISGLFTSAGRNSHPAGINPSVNGKRLPYISCSGYSEADHLHNRLHGSNMDAPGAYPVVNDTIILPGVLPMETVKAELINTYGSDLVFRDILGNIMGSGLVQNNYKVKTKYYGTLVFRISGNENTRIDIESMVYTIRNDSMMNISRGTGRDMLLRNLMLFPEGVTADLTDQAGNSKFGGVVTGDRVVLTARDRVTKKILKISCHEPVVPSAYQTHRIAQPRIMPFSAPAYSDVVMTYRWYRDELQQPWAVPAAKSFHATDFRWCYLTIVSGKSYPDVDTWIKNYVIPGGFRISGALRPELNSTLRGQTYGWDMNVEKEDGSGSTSFCPNKPLGRQFFMEHVKALVSMGANHSIQIDDGNWKEYCYCKYCKAKATEWNLDIKSAAFHTKSVLEFYKWVQSETVNYAGVPFSYSANNGSYHLYDAWSAPIDFFIGECDPRWGYGADKYFADERLIAEPLGKMQVCNLSVKGLEEDDPTRVWRNRSIAGLAYGTGGNCIVPWDSWLHLPAGGRYYGSPEEYADIFGFIRSSSLLMEGYQTAFDYMPAYSDTRYGGNKVVTITGNTRAFAYMRVVPGDSSAAVVIHLVDWRESAASQPLTVNIKSEYLFSGQDFGIYLVEPEKFNSTVHDDVIAKADAFLKPGTFRGAMNEAVYKPLRKITRLTPVRNGSQVSVSLNSIPTYAMLVLVPSTHQADLSSNNYLVDHEANIIDYTGGAYSCELLSRISRPPLTSFMVLDASGNPVYGEVKSNCKLVLQSPEGRKIKEYSLQKGQVPGISVYKDPANVPLGSLLQFDPVALDSTGIPVVFTIRNNSGTVFSLDTIISSGSSFPVQYSFSQILPGNSAEFKITFRPFLQGSQESQVSICSKTSGVLSFNFTVKGEPDLNPVLKVEFNTVELPNNSGIVDFGKILLNESRLKNILVKNTGVDNLIITDVISGLTDFKILSKPAVVEPGKSGTIMIGFTPLAKTLYSTTVTIISNDKTNDVFKFTVKGEGSVPEDMNPFINVEYDAVEMVNNTGVVDFDSVQLEVSEKKYVVIRNAGVDDLILTDVNSGLGNFRIIDRPAVVEPGKADTVVIEFTPVKGISYSTVITIISNDKTNGVFKFTVEGKGYGIGQKPVLSVEYDGTLFENYAGVVDFGLVQLNGTATRKVLVRNLGATNLSISDLKSGMTNYKILSKPVSVEYGMTDTIEIGFTPILSFSYSTSIKITSNDYTNPEFMFTVKGKGTNTVTGFNEQESPSLLVYPNPAVSEVKVRFPGDFDVRLTSMVGETLLIKTGCIDEYILNFNEFRGMYIIEVRSGNRHYFEKLVIH